MPQILDYSLSEFEVPGLAQYTPPFGTKKADGSGLTTREIVRNEMMPFLKQRPINGAPAISGGDPPMGVITQDSIAQPIEFDATFSVGAGVTLQLADPAYEGQKLTVVASFTNGSPATLILGIAGTPSEQALAAGDTYILLAVNGAWKTFKGGGTGERSVTDVVNASSYNPGTNAGGISWTDPSVPFDHLQIEDLLSPGSPVNISLGVQKFAPVAGNHNYVIRTIDSSGNVLAEYEVGATVYTVIYLANLLSVTIPLNAPNQLIMSFDNFVTCSSSVGFSIGGLSDSLTFIDQPDGKSVRLQLASKVFADNIAYTLSYSGGGTLKKADGGNVTAWANYALTNNSEYAPANFISAEIPQSEPSTLVIIMSRAVRNVNYAQFTLSGTSAKVSGVVSPTGNNLSTTIELQLDESVDAAESGIRFSMTAGGMVDDGNQQVAALTNKQVSNNSNHTAIGVSSAQVPASNPGTIQVIMEGAVKIGGTTSGTGSPTGWSVTGKTVNISSWSISDGTITFNLSENILKGETVSINYDGSDSTFKAVSGGDRIAAFSVPLVNNSTDVGGVPPGSSPRNLAITLLGHEVTGPADVQDIIDLISLTIKSGKIDNLVVGDYFGLASINIAAGNDAGGAFSATLADISGHGRNLDFVLVAKDPYYNKNGNTQHHVVFHSRNVLSTMTSVSAGGHYMTPTDTNTGGYASSKGRAFVTNQVKSALKASGIPVDDTSKILSLSRRVANGGSGATGTDTITDNVILLTEYEIFGTHTYSSSTYEAASGQTHFAVAYPDATSRIKYRANAAAGNWWEASPYAGYTDGFCSVNNGSANYTGANGGLGIAPAFVVG